uniref:Uncharacterized protein n=1 Tax=Myotis myotis TaxID=51298 RepID=A0A7J7ZXB3_MYOMY|nr:hypothetical protein mMyoMyo1_009815 [Myotis myotis]
MKGDVKWNANSGEISCINCSFYTCLNSSIVFNQSSESIYILKARPGVWLPVQKHRRWQDSPATAMLQDIAEDLLKRGKRFIGMLITVILGLIAIIASAAVAGVALQQSVQTTDFVADWHKESE